MTGGSTINDDPVTEIFAGFSSGNFDYVLVNVHIKPDDAKREIAALADVVKDADEKFANDHDIIVLGDFNADGSYFSENTITGFRNQTYTWIVSDDMDTTVATSDSIKNYVDSQVSAENLWDRTSTNLLPHTAGDDVGSTGTRISR